MSDDDYNEIIKIIKSKEKHSSTSSDYDYDKFLKLTKSKEKHSSTSSDYDYDKFLKLTKSKEKHSSTLSDYDYDKFLKLTQSKEKNLSEDDIKFIKKLVLSAKDLNPKPKDGKLMKKGENINSSSTSSPIDFLKSKKFHEINKTEIKAKKKTK